MNNMDARSTCRHLFKTNLTLSSLCMMVCVYILYTIFFTSRISESTTLQFQNAGFESRTKLPKLREDSVVPVYWSKDSERNRRIPSPLGQLNTSNPGSLQKRLDTLGLRGKNIWKVVSLIMDEWDPQLYNKKRSNDILLAANLSNSRIFISNFKNQYQLDENIHVQVNIRDGYSSRKRQGGDLLQVRMYENRKGLAAAEACHVIDFKNGSYGAVCKALWVGKPTISVGIRYYREVVLGMANVFNQMRSVLYLNATFDNGNNVETTICMAEPVIPGYKMLCNLTSKNFGMTWYCGAPRNEKISCNDWKTTKGNFPTPNLIYSSVEKNLLARTITDQPRKIVVNVRSGSVPSNQRPSCWNYSRVNLWSQQSPTGYFYNQKWIPTNCNMDRTPSVLKRCLQGRHIYLFGDSTVRQWLFALGNIFSCEKPETLWDSAEFSQPETWICPGNITVNWCPHAKPIVLAHAPRVRYGKPITSYIDSIPSNSNSILLLHMYLHFITSHPTVLIDRMMHIRKSVEKFLESSPKGVVLIKGPHAFWAPESSFGYKNDYFITLYRIILQRIFKGLLDKVVFLDLADMTVSVDSRDKHPASYVVDAMVKYMLAFVCK